MIHQLSLAPEHFMGPVLEANFTTVSVFSKLQVATLGLGISKGSFAVMVQNPRENEAEEPHWAPPRDHVMFQDFVLLRLVEVLPLPESATRLGKRCDQLMATAAAGPGLEANHCLIRYAVLGAYVTDALTGGIRFSGDPGCLSISRKYFVFSPSTFILDILTNGVLNPAQRIQFGQLRPSETMSSTHLQQEAYLCMLDIRGKRTAIFGKTRLGKSNAVKLVVQGMLDVTQETHNVSQLIFDVNGEYANDNPQDGNVSIASIYVDRCMVYHLSSRGGNKLGRLLRFNFYEQSHITLAILRELLPASVSSTEYVQQLLNCRIPALETVPGESDEVFQQRLRKIMMLWTLLDEAGFEHNQDHLANQLTQLGVRFPFNPQFRQALRMNVYQSILNRPCPPPPNNFKDMATEMKAMARFMLSYSNDPELLNHNQPVFDLDEQVMARFLVPKSSAGPFVLRSCVPFHSPIAQDFVVEVLAALAEGKTVIIDLGGANEQIVRYFSKTLSTAVFQAQEAKFVSNTLNESFVQIYFEEAHMIFPLNTELATDIYSRFAKEGAKFNIGIAYSTQSPSTVSKDLLAQTENFFVGHLSSPLETKILSQVQNAFQGMEENIMNTRTPGFMQVLTASHRYPLPVQVERFTGKSLLVSA
jgi:hypothetical protein